MDLILHMIQWMFWFFVGWYASKIIITNGIAAWADSFRDGYTGGKQLSRWRWWYLLGQVVGERRRDRNGG